MEFKKIKEKNNPLFNRKEIQFSINSDISPNKNEVKKIISEKFSTPLEAVAVKKIHSKFGSKMFVIDASLYSSKEYKDKIEPKKKEKKAKGQ